MQIQSKFHQRPYYVGELPMITCPHCKAKDKSVLLSNSHLKDLTKPAEPKGISIWFAVLLLVAYLSVFNVILAVFATLFVTVICNPTYYDKARYQAQVNTWEDQSMCMECGKLFIY